MTTTENPKAAPPGPSGRPSSLTSLPSLTGLRFYAATAVFVCHVTTGNMNLFSGERGKEIARWFNVGGGLGVSFFFILSGFILTYSARPSDTPLLFMRRRVVKLFPNHLVTFVLALLVFAGATITSWKQWLPNLFLVQTWSWDPTVTFSVNQPSWSLGCELVFYLCFPLLYRAVNKISPARLWAWAVAFLAVIVAVPVFASAVLPSDVTLPGWQTNEIQNWFIYNLPPVRMLEFVLGMLLARIVLTDRWVGVKVWQAVVLTAIAYYVSLQIPLLYALCAIWAAPIGLLIAATAVADIRAKRSPFRGRVMKWLGEVSFAVYLMQATVLIGAERHILSKHGPYTLAEGIGLALLLWVVTTALAYLLYALVEQPAMKRFSRPRRKDLGVPATGKFENAR
ncbi:acyltransferase family protein [Streptomyces sp. NPDC001414]